MGVIKDKRSPHLFENNKSLVSNTMGSANNTVKGLVALLLLVLCIQGVVCVFLLMSTVTRVLKIIAIFTLLLGIVLCLSGILLVSKLKDHPKQNDSC